MKLSFSLVAGIIGSTGVLFAHAAPQAGSLIPIADYNLLKGICEKGGDDVYVGVRYADGSLTTFKFNQCYPYQLPKGALAQQAVFCRSATCYNNPHPDCTGGSVPPVPVPVLAGLTFSNVEDCAQLLGEGAMCQRNGLSGIPL